MNKSNDTESAAFVAQITSIVSNTEDLRRRIAETLNNYNETYQVVSPNEGVISMITLSATACKDNGIDKESFLALCDVIYDLFEIDEEGPETDPKLDIN